MINIVINSFKLNNAYSTNSFIYNIKKIPLIGKYILTDLYGNENIIGLINILVGIFKIIKPFIGKIIYVGLMIYIPVISYKDPNSFLNVFVFLTIVGGFCNTDMFNPNRSKYYSIILMRMNSKKYAISNFIWFLVKTLISFYPAIVVFGILSDVNIYLLLLLPLFVINMKLIGNFVYLKYYEKKKKVLNENNFLITGIIGTIGLSLAYILPGFNYNINPFIFIIVLIISLFLAVYSLIYILHCNNYNKIYKRLLTLNNIIFDASSTNTTNMKKQYESKIDSDINIDSNKNGYEYFNELFIKRHKYILTKSAIKISLVALVTIIIIFIGTRLDSSIYKDINKMTLSYLPYFVFVMYIINRGTVITRAMFINCDNSMLSYRFYRNPKVILSLFKLRLKTLIKINMIPTITIALGLPFLLFVTGGTTNNINYVLLFISIIFLSIFFSTYHLVIYYLLQPYDINMKSKSATYSIINTVTYILCYYCTVVTFPTITFALLITVISVVCIFISLYLVCKYAPKTFRLK